MKTIQELTCDYIGRVRTVLDSIAAENVEQIARLLLECHRNGRTIFVIGNGGSASTASHMGCDLSKATASAGRSRLRVVSLTDNMAWFSALANDIAYESVFVEQLRNLFQPGDVLLAISASGNSPNLVKAMEFARENGGRTIALVGFTGGKMKQLADASIHVTGSDYGPVEDGHLIINHLLTEYIRGCLAAPAA